MRLVSVQLTMTVRRLQLRQIEQCWQPSPLVFDKIKGATDANFDPTLALIQLAEVHWHA